MTCLEIAALLRRIDLSSGAVNEPLVPEILSQVTIVGIQQACIAGLRQCHDMRIIGPTETCSSECCCPLFDLRIVHASRPSAKQGLLQPNPERTVSPKLFAQLAADDQLASPEFDPFAECFASRRAVLAEHLMHDIVVKDGAHDYRPIDRLVSSMKN